VSDYDEDDYSEGIKVNVSKKETAAGNQTMLPRGWYKVTVSDVELRESKSEKNNGKPMYAVECTVNEPAEYEGRKLYTNACLWEGALYTVIGLMKAVELIEQNIDEGDLVIPGPGAFLGKECMARVTITPPRKGPDGKEYDERNELKSFATLAQQQVKVGSQSAIAGTATAKGGSLLPS